LGEVRDGDGLLPRFFVETPVHVDRGAALEPKSDEIYGLGGALVGAALGSEG
jgi:hypothetical protein